MNNVKAIQKLNEVELKLGLDTKKSWHDMYSDSAYIFIGGLNYDLTEGDILAVFSQYGEIININLVKDKKTTKSKGFCFLCYEDQRSTVLAVDNFNGIKLCGRTIRVDHVKQYRRPKDEHGNEIFEVGCAPKTPTPSPSPSESSSPEPERTERTKSKHKHKKRKKGYKSEGVTEFRHHYQKKKKIHPVKNLSKSDSATSSEPIATQSSKGALQSKQQERSARKKRYTKKRSRSISPSTDRWQRTANPPRSRSRSPHKRHS